MADELRVGEESRLEGQPLGTFDLGLTDGKLRMQTLGPRQRVRQGYAFQALIRMCCDRRLLGRGRAARGDHRRGRTQWRALWYRPP